jgi:hypothetical protein
MPQIFFPSKKKKKQTKAGGAAQVVEHLTSKGEGLRSSPSTAKTKQTNKKKTLKIYSTHCFPDFS